jgi:hypothetical protein
MKLLWEKLDGVTLTPEIITEAETGKKNYFLYGPTIIAEQKNRNGRIYRGHIIEREVNKLLERMADGDCGGECNHPQSPELNFDRLSHYLTEVKRDGNVWYTKNLVASTPMGQLIKNIIDDNKQKIGISTRGLGSVDRSGMVGEDYVLICNDLVSKPSGPGAFLSSILESKEYIIQLDGTIAEKVYDTFESKLAKLPKREVEKYLMEAVNQFLKGIR